MILSSSVSHSFHIEIWSSLFIWMEIILDSNGSNPVVSISRTIKLVHGSGRRSVIKHANALDSNQISVIMSPNYFSFLLLLSQQPLQPLLQSQQQDRLSSLADPLMCQPLPLVPL